MRRLASFILIITLFITPLISVEDVLAVSEDQMLNAGQQNSQTVKKSYDLLTRSDDIDASTIGVITSDTELPESSKQFYSPSESHSQARGMPTPLDGLGLYNGLIDYSDVLLIVNDDSQISKDIGDYFVEKRNIPKINICNVSISTSETITGTIFADLRTQIENYITNNGLKTKLNFLVTTKGVPLRVSYGGNSRASVDADLALILGKYSNNIGGTNPMDNPYHDKDERFSKSKYDFYLVTRLTGYTVDEAKGLIDKATVSLGQRGMFMLDVSPARDGGGYQVGNDWMRSAYTILNQKGFNVTLDETNPFITDIKNVSGYCSWGSNDGRYSTNHILNSNLETDGNGDKIPDNWYIQRDTGDNWSRNNSESQSGSWSMEVTRTGITSNFSALSQNFTVQPGVRYYTAGYVNLTNMSSSGKGVFLQIAARDKSDNIIKYYNGSVRKSNTNGFVSLSQKHYEPIDGVTKITISVVFQECSGTVHIDNIRLYEIKPHNTYIPGAIAETIVSTGGRSFNYPTAYGQSLVADMIREGVTGVKGYVYEPYLSAISHPDILFDRYTDGYNLAESYYMGSIWLSWMGVVVGDPKVAPYINELAELTSTNADLNFSMTNPTEGDKIILKGIIYNTGKASANNFNVKFFIGDPDVDGVELLDSTKSKSVTSQGSEEVQYTWYTENDGMYNIYMKFDTDDVIMEQNEIDNKINRTIYINSRPAVENFQVSPDTILRTHTLSINVNGTDKETQEGAMICLGEYKYSQFTSEADWKPLPIPTYNGQWWIFNLTVNKTFNLGYYDVRVMFDDNNSLDNPGFCDWVNSDDAFEVKNNNPVIINMSISKSEIFRLDNVSIDIYAEDMETPPDKLTCDLEILYPDNIYWTKFGNPIYTGSSWRVEYITATDSILGLYSFRALIYDDETSRGTSQLYTINDVLNVKNNPAAVLNLSVEASEIYRLDELNVIIQASDIEDPDEKLIGTVEYRFNTDKPSLWNTLSKYTYSLEDDIGTWTTAFKPKKDAFLGYYDFRARFTDRDSEDTGWVYLNHSVKVNNNLPVVETLEVNPITIVLSESSTVGVMGYDSEHTRSDLICEVEFASTGSVNPSVSEDETASVDTSSLEWSELEVVQLTNRWEAVFSTDNSTPTGYYHIRSRLIDPDILNTDFNDYDNNLWIYLYDALSVHKGFSEPKEIIIESDEIKPGESQTITITSGMNRSENDETTCIVQYQDPSGEWYNLPAVYDPTKGEGIWIITLTKDDTANPGEYKFRLQFISPKIGSSDWMYLEDTITVTESEPTKVEGKEDTTAQSLMLILVIVVIILVLVIAVIAFISKRKKSRTAIKKKQALEGAAVKGIDGEWIQPKIMSGAQPGVQGLPQTPVYTAEIVDGQQSPGMPGIQVDSMLPVSTQMPVDQQAAPGVTPQPMSYDVASGAAPTAETTITEMQQPLEPSPGSIPALPPGTESSDNGSEVIEEGSENISDQSSSNQRVGDSDEKEIDEIFDLNEDQNTSTKQEKSIESNESKN
jgi:uncharacterized protein (TIGR03790 family)